MKEKKISPPVRFYNHFKGIVRTFPLIPYLAACKCVSNLFLKINRNLNVSRRVIRKIQSLQFIVR